MALVVMYEPGMERIDNITEGAAYNACKEIASDARRYTPVLTGAMRRSIRARRTKTGGRVYVGTDHWFFVEYGVDPHIIKVKNYGTPLAKKSLVRKQAGARSKFFGTWVIHPGMSAVRPLRRAFYQKRSMATLVIPGL